MKSHFSVANLPRIPYDVALQAKFEIMSERGMTHTAEFDLESATAMLERAILLAGLEKTPLLSEECWRAIEEKINRNAWFQRYGKLYTCLYDGKRHGASRS